MTVFRRAMEDDGVIFIPVNGGGQGVRLKEPEAEQPPNNASPE